MDIYWEGLKEAIRLIVHLDPEVLQVFLLSIYVSGAAVILGMILGVPLGTLLALNRFPGRGVILSIVHTFMGLPPVVVGLFVFIALSRNGPLGGLQLLFTPSAMIFAQVIIVTPIIAGLSHAAIGDIDPKLIWQSLSLGASRIQLVMTLLREVRFGLIAAVIAGFGRAIAEVGAVMMVGGNLKGMTQVMTTFIVEETRKGNWARSIALGLILILFAYLINIALTRLQRGSEAR